MSIGAAKQFFDDVGLRYEESFGNNPGHISFVTRSLERINAGPSVRVLDIGQGTGWPTASMAASSGCQVHGIDLSSVMTSIAKKRVPTGTFETVNMLDYEPDAPFDAAFAIHCTGQLTHAQMIAAIAKWAFWVKPGGYLFLGTMLGGDFEPGVFQPSVDGEMVGKIGRAERVFMGERCVFSIYTQDGWREMLSAVGFEIVDSNMSRYYAPDCDMEPHSFITCRKP